MPRASDADRRSRRRGDDGRRSQRQRSHRKENGDKCDLQATAATRRLKRQRRASDEPRFVVARQRKQRNPTHTYARRAKKELNRGRLEMRKTKVFRVARGVSRRVSAPCSEGLGAAEWTGLRAGSPLSDHQAGRAAKFSAKCSAGIGQKQSAK